MTPDSRQVFYSESRGTIDLCQEDGSAQISGKSRAEIEAVYGPVEIISLDEAVARHEAKFISEPAQIDSEKFVEMLEALPPLHWRSDSAGESFQMSELTSGRVTGVYVRIGEQHFSWNDIVGTPHTTLLDKARNAFPNDLGATPQRPRAPRMA